MPPKRPRESSDEGGKKQKRPNSGSSIPSIPSVSPASSVFSETGGMDSWLPRQFRHGVVLDPDAINALRREHIYPPDDPNARDFLPGGKRAITPEDVEAFRQAMLELSNGLSDDDFSSSDDDSLSPPPQRGPVQAIGHLAYTGKFIIPDNELDPRTDRHRYWGACDNEVRLVLPPSEIMSDMRSVRWKQATRLKSSLMCNLTVQEIEKAIKESGIVCPVAQGDYIDHLSGLKALVRNDAEQSDTSTLSLYRLLVENCLPGGLWAERCGVRDTVNVLAPVLGFRDLEFLCSPSAGNMNLQELLDRERNNWLNRQLHIDILHHANSLHLLEQERFDLHLTGADKDSVAGTNSDGSSVSGSGSGSSVSGSGSGSVSSVSGSGSGSVSSGSGSGSGSVSSGSGSSGSGSGSSVSGSGSVSIGRGGKRRKPATKRKASRSASSKRKPTSTKRRRTHNARRRR